MLAIDWNNELMSGDLVVGGSGLGRDDSLRTAVLLSLFSDARARADDPLPDGSDRRGWVGDALADDAGDRFGSRLWLLAREKQTEETRRRAEDYAREALDWLIEDRLAVRIDVTATWIRASTLGLEIAIHLTTGGVERHAAALPIGGDR